MSSGVRLDPRTTTTPVTDLSLLALCDDAGIASLSAAVGPVAPELRGDFDQLVGRPPGPHVTLHEFLTVHGLDEDVFRPRRGRPGSLHVTIARAPEAAVPAEAAARRPLDLTIAFDRFGLALATELPYGGLSWLHTSRGRLRR